MADYFLVRYNVNGGTISSNTSTTGVYHHSGNAVNHYSSVSASPVSVTYFKANNSLVNCCATEAGSFSIFQNRYNVATAYHNLTNVTTFGITRTGYHVDAKSEYRTGATSGTILNQDSSSSNTTNPATTSTMGASANKTITVYVNWQANTYTITCHSQYSSGDTTTNKTATYNSSLSLPSYSQSGYTFKGWATTSTGSATYTSNSLTASQINTLVAGKANGATIHLYAKWEYNGPADTTAPSNLAVSVYSHGILQNHAIIGVTFTATDNVGITGYYYGTSSSSSVTYTSVTSTTNFSQTCTITGTGTYYFRVKDAAGNTNYTTKTFYTIDYSVTNGTTNPAALGTYGMIAMSGESITLPDITPDDGYSSPGKWTYSSSTYNVNSSYTVTASRTFTATCTKLAQTTITFNLNGGTGYISSTPPSSCTTGGTFSGSGATNVAYAVGHTAEDYYTSANNAFATNGNTAYVDYNIAPGIPISATVTSLKIRCHGCRERTYSASETNNIADITIYSGSTINTNSTYASGRFNSTSLETVEFDLGTSIGALALALLRLRFTVGYYGGQMRGITVEVKYTTSSSLTHTLTKGQSTYNKTEVGYYEDREFLGWYTTTSGSVQVYDANGEYTSNSTYWNSGNWNYSSETLTLYAHWSIPIYTITLNNQSATTAGTTTIYEKYGTGYYSNSTATSSISSITKPTKTGYTFNGYYTSTGGSGTQIINSSGTIIVSSNTFSSNTTIYAYWTEPTYTLTVQYHLNGGTISDVVHQQSSGSTNYYTFKSDSLIYRCNSDGSNPFLFTHSFRCKPSESQNSQVKKCSSANTVWEIGEPDLLNVSSCGATRASYAVPSGTTAWRRYSSSGYTISQNATTVYAILGNQNLTQDTTITVYINWAAPTNTYSLDVQYNLNGGSINSSNGIYYNSSTNAYYKVINGLLHRCTSTGTRAIPHRTHLEYDSSNDTIDLLNYTAYKAVNDGYKIVTTREYKTEHGTIINQEQENTNKPTVANISETSTLANRVVTLYLNWVLKSGGTVYVKTADGTWKQGTIYVKTGTNTWEQGTPYIKTGSTTWTKGV